MFNEPNNNEGYYGYIYLTRNLVNNKKYIGQKKSTYFRGSEYLGSGLYLKHALTKYGRDNFSVILVGWYENKDELDKAEQYWIKYYDACNSDEFYNLQAGGYRLGMLAGSRRSAEAESKHSASITGEKHFLYGKIKITKDGKMKYIEKSELRNYIKLGWIKGISEEFRKVLSENHADFSGENNPMYGVSLSKENHPNYKKLWINLDDNEMMIHENELTHYLKLGWSIGMKVRTYKLVCNNCGKEFTHTHNSTKYCSKECKLIKKNERKYKC